MNKHKDKSQLTVYLEDDTIKWLDQRVKDEMEETKFSLSRADIVRQIILKAKDALKD